MYYHNTCLHFFLPSTAHQTYVHTMCDGWIESIWNKKGDKLYRRERKRGGEKYKFRTNVYVCVFVFPHNKK